jgi:3-oxoadipate enol-lactonase
MASGTPVELNFIAAGPEDAPALIFVHGLGDSSLIWKPWMDAYAPTWRVIAPDLRGHGDSPRPSSYDLTDMVADLEALIDRLNLAPAVIVAHSMGAMITYLLAEHRPDLVRALLLEEPPPPVPADPPRDEGQRPDRDLTYDWNIQAPFSHHRNHPDPTWLPGLRAITCPVLILRGTQSHINRTQVEAMTAELPNAHLTELEAGHDLHTESPEAFTHHLTDFLQTHTQ